MNMKSLVRVIGKCLSSLLKHVDSLTIFGDLSHAMDCMRVFENTDLHFHNEDLLQELNERIHRLSSAGQHSEAGSLARHVQSALTDVNPPRTPVQWLWFGFDDVYSVHKRLVMMYQNIGAYPSAETIQEDIVRCCWYRQQVPRQDLKLEEEVESLARMYSAFLDRCGGYNFLVGMHRTTLALTRAARLDIEELYRKMDIWESVGEIPGAPHIAADQNACTLLRRLCEMKADLNTEYNEDTPLHIAASNGSYEAVEILLEAGADVNARIHDYTPLHIATRRALTRIVELLLHKGADPGLRNHWHRTALDIAQEDGYTDIVAVFQRHEQQRQITSNGSLEVGSTMMDQEHYSYHRTG